MTMRLNDAFPSQYIKADADVPEEGNLIVTIRSIEMRTLGQGKDAEQKPVASFDEIDKEWVINKTNFLTIAKALGSDDTDDWIGRRVALYSADVNFGSEQVRGIRVRPKAPTPAPAASRPAPRVAAGTAARTAPVNPDADPVEDDIPFRQPMCNSVMEWEEDPFGRRGLR
jgi:hypothetical protein